MLTSPQGSLKLQEKEGITESCNSLLCLTVILGVTDCQKDEAGLQCDQNGQYQAIQKDRDSGEVFCVDIEGQRIQWLQTEAGLSESQCLSMY